MQLGFVHVDRVCVCVCVCVCVRERERERVCVCVYLQLLFWHSELKQKVFCRGLETDAVES